MILPNQLTTLRIILSPAFLILFLSENVIYRQISFVVFLIAALTDWYDGWLARKFNYITDWGRFMDPLADKILVSTAFFAYVIIDKINLWLVLIIVIRDFAVTGLRILGEFKKIPLHTSFSAKIKTFLQMGFIYLLLLSDFIVISNFEDNLTEFIKKNFIDNFTVLNYTMLIIALITVYTGVEYFWKSRKVLKKLFKFN